MFTTVKPLVLASGSPRRQQFLRDLGLSFTIALAEGDEPRPEVGESPEDYARRTAEAKAGQVASRYPDAVVLAADTIVVLGKAILGKPRDTEESLHMLERLSGRTHVVITAVCLLLPQGERVTFHCASRVRFHAWPRAVLRAYAATGESLDKAGGYAVQGQGSFLVAQIEGSWTSVVGLPVAEVTSLLLEYGVLELR